MTTTPVAHPSDDDQPNRDPSLAHPVSYSWRILSSDLKSSTRLVALAIALLADNPDKTAYPSYARLGQMTGISRGRVIAHVNTLVELGWLLRRSGGGKLPTGRGIANRYQLVLPSPTVPAHAHNPDLPTSTSLPEGEGCGPLSEPLAEIDLTEAAAVMSHVYRGCTPDLQVLIDEDWESFQQKTRLGRMVVGLRRRGLSSAQLVEELSTTLTTARHPVRVMYHRLSHLCAAESVDPNKLDADAGWDPALLLQLRAAMRKGRDPEA